MSKIFGICMVKDEEDIIQYILEHLLSEGLDQIIILDNLSTDGTRDILNDMSRQYKNILIKDDPEIAYYQSAKMTALCHEVGSLGADWIVPFDADEFWYAVDGSTLAEKLRSIEEPVVEATSFDHLPTENDPYDINPLKRIVYREKGHQVFPCVAFRYEPGLTLLQGNHSVIRSGNRDYSSFQLRHFQYRNFEQFSKKLRNGKVAYDATNLPLNEGQHWREMGALGDDEMLLKWKEFLSKPLIYDPAPIRL